MKTEIVMVMLMVLVAGSIGLPRSKRQANEPRLSNEVLPGVIEMEDETSQETTTTKVTELPPTAAPTTTKTPALDDIPTAKPGNNRHKTKQNGGSAVSETFSRVIDDIFNIPISVLRAVNSLINNAFGTKQASAAASANVEVAASSAA